MHRSPRPFGWWRGRCTLAATGPNKRIAHVPPYPLTHAGLVSPVHAVVGFICKSVFPPPVFLEELPDKALAPCAQFVEPENPVV